MSLSPTLTGSLASARGYGGALAALLVVLTSPRRVGVLYWCGIALSSAVMPFATTGIFWVTMAAAIVCGSGVGSCVCPTPTPRRLAASADVC
eukprot:COSAG04_NODE_4360_length_2138_cov_14.393330_3_plen_92_part_00